MELLDILKIINIVLTLALLTFAYSKLKDRKSKILFILMYAFIILSTILFSDEEHISAWLKHTAFYTGQFLMFLFLRRIIKLHLDSSQNDDAIVNVQNVQQRSFMQESHEAVPTKTIKTENTVSSDNMQESKDVTLKIHISFLAWFLFVTEQGLQHILVLPFYFLITSYVKVHFAFIHDKSFKKTLNILIFAFFILVLVHAGEFVVESQKIIPLLEDDIYEYIEMGLFYLSAFIFYIGLGRLKQ